MHTCTHKRTRKLRSSKTVKSNYSPNTIWQTKRQQQKEQSTTSVEKGNNVKGKQVINISNNITVNETSVIGISTPTKLQTHLQTHTQ
ncbi:unnamed protein product, partial [Ceratitis capitata]